MTSAAGFQRSTFDHCKFYNVTLFLPEAVAQQLLAESTAKGEAMEIIGINA